ncbi:serine O-acetyltransferase [Tamlana sp. I1]|uniref:serine O-acetyltransferase n=1 Tax=Tamlana sp. I1 TaxID=2762061 RepID=UPI0018906131|nr:DapH/DapD/GlmU-related protein [Tamlana sp. I1]
MLKKFKTDIKKYKTYSGKSTIVLCFTQQGLWALLVYRISHAVFISNAPKFLKKLLLLFCVLGQKWIEIITGISIPYTARIGERFYIGHFGGIIINGNAIIGDNCNISQGVTIGVSGVLENRGTPIIGDNVYIGANAVIAGNISIGNSAVIGANSLVTKNVEARTTVLGVPAVVVSNNSSEHYI